MTLTGATLNNKQQGIEMNRKQKWKKQKMDTLEFAEYVEDMTGDALMLYGNDVEKRHQYVIDRSPFEDMEEIGSWIAGIGGKLLKEIVAKREMEWADADGYIVHSVSFKENGEHEHSWSKYEYGN